MFYYNWGNGLGFQLGFWVDSHQSISLELPLGAHSTTHTENGTRSLWRFIAITLIFEKISFQIQRK